jgi:alpha-L-fucosidase
VDVATPGDYQVELTYKGEGRLVWRIETDEGVKLQNQQNSASVYHAYPFGLLSFATAGKHTLTVSLIDGDRAKASLSAVRVSPMEISPIESVDRDVRATESKLPVGQQALK